MGAENESGAAAAARRRGWGWRVGECRGCTLVQQAGRSEAEPRVSRRNWRPVSGERWLSDRQRSPITHFEKCRTPLLILHGTSDTRVHPAQSLALYRAVKTYGKAPVRLVRYPGEPHGNRRTGSRLDFSLRLMRWMNHYLKGPGGDPPDYALDLSEIKPEAKEEDDSSE